MNAKLRVNKGNGHTSLKLWPFFMFVFAIVLSACSATECEDCIYRSAEKEFLFDGLFIDLKDDDTTFYSIKMNSGSGMFLLQNKLQYETVKYESFQRKKSNYKSTETTGYKENESRIWLHPPRTDKFKRVTQLAPYPQISFPFKVGDEYSGSITNATNWGDWSGKASSYQLVIKEIETDSLTNSSVVLLAGVGTLGSDTCTVEFLFSTEKGFFRWDYTWNDSAKFVMNLTNDPFKLE